MYYSYILLIKYVQLKSDDLELALKYSGKTKEKGRKRKREWLNVGNCERRVLGDGGPLHYFFLYGLYKFCMC